VIKGRRAGARTSAVGLAANEIAPVHGLLVEGQDIAELIEEVNHRVQGPGPEPDVPAELQGGSTNCSVADQNSAEEPAVAEARDPIEHAVHACGVGRGPGLVRRTVSEDAEWQLGVVPAHVIDSASGCVSSPLMPPLVTPSREISPCAVL
jgi:hypothetical protein